LSDEAAPAAKPRRWPRRLFGWLAALLGLVAALLGLLDTGIGHRFVAERIGALRPASGLRFQVGRIDGSLYSQATLRNFRISDPKGLVFAAPRVTLDWRPFAWVRNRLQIERLIVPRAIFAKLPQTIRTGRQGPILPGFDIHIGELRVERLTVGPAITGVARTGRLVGRADIRSGRALVDLAAAVAGSDRLRLRIDAEPDRDRFDLDLAAQGSASGVLAKASGLGKPLAVAVIGDGSWTRWRGQATADVAGKRIAALRLGNRAGAYTLDGTLAPASITKGKLQRLTTPRVLVAGAAKLANRQLAGTLSLRSPRIVIETSGGIDLAASAYRDVRIRARLLRPPALFGNMTGRNVELRAIVDGAFASARFDYRLTADRFAFDKTGFEIVRAAGKGRLSKSPVLVPIRFTARRVTGVGDVAGGILNNLGIAGVLRVTSTMLTGDDLRLTSDKLQARATLLLDLRTGRFEIGLSGGLRRYLIPGLGIVDVETRLKVVPGPNGRGTRVIGTGTAQMIRLDNAFFRSLTGGLPRIVTGLERGPDGVLYLRNLVLTSPLLRLSGNGQRRRDGSFRFEGGGTHQQYGPVTLTLDGRIEKPTLDLRFARPNATLGLRDVRAHLDPTLAGYAFTAAGQSSLGGFTGAGDILLPRGGTARIAVARLDVSGTRASGALDIVAGGFEGALALAGGGLAGELRFRPVDGHQRIDARIDADNATLAENIRVRRGQLNFAVVLDPNGTTVDATATAQGIRRGSLSIARMAANARLRDGAGEVRASIAGSRGRGFDIQTVTQVRDGSFSVLAQGTVDRRQLRLATPAVLTRDGDRWRLAPTQVEFAGGTGQLSGAFGGGETSMDASLTKMPLSVLDIGYPGLALGGSASGTLRFVERDGEAPTGRIDMTVRGLSRSGLVLSSRPIDVGIAGVLEPGKAAVRAVMASGGKIVGRAQARIAPLTSGGLPERLTRAPMFAQLRYDGPADTLWRLTGIELFDLSGPVAIGADVGGTIDDPRIRGSLRTDNARIESAVTGTVLSNVQATGRFGGSRLVIDRFTAQAGKDGTVTATGGFDFGAPGGGVGIDLKLDAQNAVMIARDDIGATVTGPLAIKSEGAGGTISGDVQLVRSRYRLGRASAAAAVPRLAIREINLPFGGNDDDAAPRQPWKMDIRARAEGGLQVTGLGLSSEWSTSLRIRGEPTNPAITGRADLVRGDYEFAGREFDLERGLIRFDGQVPANPTLDIAANADSQGLSATIRVTGNAAKPEIGFSSIPALPEDELLSRLLFGTSITALSAPEALQLAAAVAALQDGDGGLNPINAVRRAAGLDRLRILPADLQIGRGTAVAAGKYITRRTYVEIVTDGQGYSATQVEFQVTRWLSLLSTISTIGRQSANVRVSKDY
jgi:translocation and assembly module TamB